MAASTTRNSHQTASHPSRAGSRTSDLPPRRAQRAAAPGPDPRRRPTPCRPDRAPTPRTNRDRRVLRRRPRSSARPAPAGRHRRFSHHRPRRARVSRGRPRRARALCGAKGHAGFGPRDPQFVADDRIERSYARQGQRSAPARHRRRRRQHESHRVFRQFAGGKRDAQARTPPSDRVSGDQDAGSARPSNSNRSANHERGSSRSSPRGRPRSTRQVTRADSRGASRPTTSWPTTSAAISAFAAARTSSATGSGHWASKTSRRSSTASVAAGATRRDANVRTETAMRAASRRTSVRPPVQSAFNGRTAGSRQAPPWERRSTRER